REHVAEIASGMVEIVGIARDPGYRSAVAVISRKPAVDAVGACVGNRGDRVKRLVAALGGEHIDIILWNESAENFIKNLLAPLQSISIDLDKTTKRATVVLRQGSEPPPSRHFAIKSSLLLQLTGLNLKLVSENDG